MFTLTTFLILYICVAILWGGWTAYTNHSIDTHNTIVVILKSLFISGAFWPISVVQALIKKNIAIPLTPPTPIVALPTTPISAPTIAASTPAVPSSK